MRNIVPATAIAIALASGLSFAAADHDSQGKTESGMMGDGTHMQMMEDMREMMGRCRDMMKDMADKAPARAEGTSI